MRQWRWYPRLSLLLTAHRRASGLPALDRASQILGDRFPAFQSFSIGHMTGSDRALAASEYPFPAQSTTAFHTFCFRRRGLLV
jgi:hypothetical protein